MGQSLSSGRYGGFESSPQKRCRLPHPEALRQQVGLPKNGWLWCWYWLILLLLLLLLLLGVRRSALPGALTKLEVSVIVKLSGTALMGFVPEEGTSKPLFPRRRARQGNRPMDDLRPPIFRYPACLPALAG